MNQGFEQRSPSPLSQKPEVSSAPQWRDLWAAVLFYIQLLAAVALGSYALYKLCSQVYVLYKSHSQVFEKMEGLVTRDHVISILWGLGGCLALSTTLLVVALYLFRYHPVAAIHGAFLGQISLCVIYLLHLLLTAISSGYDWNLMGSLLSNALFLTITTGFYLVLRGRIPFSAAILGLVNDTIYTYPKILLLSLYKLVIMVFVFVFYTSSGLTILYSGDYFQACTAFMVASGLWTWGVVGNVFYTTAAGVFATAYFTGSGQKVERATSSSFRRAITYSFGSICLGSLIVTAIQLTRLLVMSICKKGSLARSILQSLVEIVEDLAAYFNSFAYIEIAIYGKPFRQSGKDVWSLIKRRGMDAVINDSIIGTVRFFATITAQQISGMIIDLACRYLIAVPFYALLVYQVFNALFISIAFYQILGVFVTGSRTVVVCLAEDPAALQRNDPDAYGLITREYGDLML